MKTESIILEKRAFRIDDGTNTTYDLYLVTETYMDTEVISVYVAEEDKQPYSVARFLPEDLSEEALYINLSIWGSLVSGFEILKSK